MSLNNPKKIKNKVHMREPKKNKIFGKENGDNGRRIWKWSVTFCQEKRLLFGCLFWENQ